MHLTPSEESVWLVLSSSLSFPPPSLLPSLPLSLPPSSLLRSYQSRFSRVNRVQLCTHPQTALWSTVTLSTCVVRLATLVVQTCSSYNYWKTRRLPELWLQMEWRWDEGVHTGALLPHQMCCYRWSSIVRQIASLSHNCRKWILVYSGSLCSVLD